MLDDFLRAATIDPNTIHKSGSVEPARRLLAQHPEAVRQSVFAATAVGDIAALNDAISINPSNATIRGGPHEWSPLLYLCFSRFLQSEKHRSEDFVKCAKLLLSHCADANDYWPEKDRPDFRETALYGASGIANHAGVTRLLIQSGAKVTDPPDGETLYHTVEHTDDHECLKLVLAARPHQASLDYCLLHQLDYEDAEGCRLMLAAGARPTHVHETIGYAALHWALWRGRSDEVVRAVLAGKPDLHLKDRQGRTPYVYAKLLGRNEVAEMLADQNAESPLTLSQEFVAACAIGNIDEAKSLLAKTPDIIASLTDAELLLLNENATTGNLTGVKTMLDLGWPIDRKGPMELTALQDAIIGRHTAIVRLLIDRGFGLTIKNQFGGDALGCACWACENHANKDAESILKFVMNHFPPDRIAASRNYYQQRNNEQMVAILSS